MTVPRVRSAGLPLPGCPPPGRADGDRAVAALGQEVEAVVDILAERHEEGVGVIAGFRQPGFLVAQDVADHARIEILEDRVDRAVAIGVGIAVARFGQADEGLVGGAPVLVALALVVAVAGEVAIADGDIVIARARLAF